MKKIYMKILLWIQGWAGWLNSWAWTEWSRIHRKDQKEWVEDYEKKIKIFDDENNNDS